MATRFDAIIIGTGQAGPPLAGRLTKAGRRVAIIERRRFGGTCVNYGCTPTKALVASARAAHMARRAADFGVAIEGSVRVDMAKVKARKDEIAGRSNESITAYIKDMDNSVVFQEHAVFVADKRLRVGNETIEADTIFINVGARAAIPPIEGLDQVPYLTNSSILDLATLPESLVILGGGYVGVEFGQMYQRFGSEVTIVDHAPRLMSSEDEDVSEEICRIFEGEGIEMITGAKVEGVARAGDGIIGPPFARVGASETELRKAGRKALIARLRMSEVARAREMSETQGFMKVMVDAHTRRILGAQMIGTRCDEVIHCVLYVMYTGAPYTAIERAVPIHPNVAELLPTMLKQLEPLE